MECFVLIHVGLLEITVSEMWNFIVWNELRATACEENINSEESSKLFGLFLSSVHKIILIQEPNLSI